MFKFFWESNHQNWITDEKDWCVVPDEVPVAILSVKFDSKTTWISNSVSTA